MKNYKTQYDNYVSNVRSECVNGVIMSYDEYVKAATANEAEELARRNEEAKKHNQSTRYTVTENFYGSDSENREPLIFDTADDALAHLQKIGATINAAGFCQKKVSSECWATYKILPINEEFLNAEQVSSLLSKIGRNLITWEKSKNFQDIVIFSNERFENEKFNKFYTEFYSK